MSQKRCKSADQCLKKTFKFHHNLEYLDYSRAYKLSVRLLESIKTEKEFHWHDAFVKCQVKRFFNVDNQASIITDEYRAYSVSKSLCVLLYCCYVTELLSSVLVRMSIFENIGYKAYILTFIRRPTSDVFWFSSCLHDDPFLNVHLSTSRENN